jgi:tRNA pseudouridine55 synthase
VNGVVNLLKPSGMTSHDAVAIARRLFNQRRIGHGGTLDPGVSGVLPLFLGWATRLVRFMPDDKRYRAEMTLGISTETQDGGGATVEVAREVHITPRQLGEAFAAFLGVIEQTPPMLSAVRVSGRRLYELAREGQVIERQPRSVEIYEMHIRKIWPEEAPVLGIGSRVLFDVHCSAGTYIRTLCVDIGARLGCPAHMSYLVRTGAGPLSIDDAVTLEELEAAESNDRLAEYVLPPTAAVEHLTPVTADVTAQDDLFHGRKFMAEATGDVSAAVRVQDSRGRLLALAEAVPQHPGLWQPICVFPRTDDGRFSR